MKVEGNIPKGLYHCYYHSWNGVSVGGDKGLDGIIKTAKEVQEECGGTSVNPCPESCEILRLLRMAQKAQAEKT